MKFGEVVLNGHGGHEDVIGVGLVGEYLLGEEGLFDQHGPLSDSSIGINNGIEFRL